MIQLARHEVIRQLLHLAQVWLMFVVIIFGMKLGVVITAVALLILWILEANQPRPTTINLWKQWLVKHVVREQEQSKYHGARMLFYGALIVMIVGAVAAIKGWLPRPVAINAIVMALTMLTIGDSFSAIIGPIFNGPSILGRHLSGAVGFILAGMVTSLILGVPWVTAFIIAIAAAITELVTPRKWDDNITIPVVSFVVTILLLI